MVNITSIAYPHTAIISRKVTSATPPFTSTSSTLWEGAVDCQVGGTDGTRKQQTVYVSDYIIYSACISPELQTGDIITVTMGSGKTPFECTIKQHTTEDIWEEGGVHYGTTIWANLVRG